MAAIAIPIVVLGSLYILSEQEKKKENFIEENAEEMIAREGFSNYETRKIEDFEKQQANLVNSYSNSNQHTDRFFINNNISSLRN